MSIDAATILVDALKRMSVVIALPIVSPQQNLPEAIPRCDDLKLRLFRNRIPFAVEGDALVDNYANINGTCAAFVERFKELQMRSKNSHAATDEFNRRALVDVYSPPNSSKECSNE